MTADRRLHPRTTVRIEAWLRRTRDGEWEPALVQDLSASGASVRTLELLALQTEVALRFSLEGGSLRAPLEVEVPSLVVRNGEGAAVEGLTTFAGLHFLALEPGPFEAVRSWVWERLHAGE